VSSGPRAQLAPNLRIAFAVAWIVAQLVLVLTASRRPDAAFGFRMFPESSTISVSLARSVMGPAGVALRLPVHDGTWSAHDREGVPHVFSWKERVRRPELSTFDVEMSASYGAAAQLARWQAALDDVARHVALDAETGRLFLDVTIRRNGQEPRVVHLASPELERR
jgi:hypothetical protein